MKEFFFMGGYAFFVWTSYALVAAVLIGNVILAKMYRKNILKNIREYSEENELS